MEVKFNFQLSMSTRHKFHSLGGHCQSTRNFHKIPLSPQISWKVMPFSLFCKKEICKLHNVFLNDWKIFCMRIIPPSSIFQLSMSTARLLVVANTSFTTWNNNPAPYFQTQTVTNSNILEITVFKIDRNQTFERSAKKLICLYKQKVHWWKLGMG